MKRDMISVGGISIDCLFRVENIPKPNEATKIIESHVYYSERAPNVAVICQKLGLKTRIVSAAGRDFESSRYASYLLCMGIDLRGIQKSDAKMLQLYIFTNKSWNQFTFEKVIYNA